MPISLLFLGGEILAQRQRLSGTSHRQTSSARCRLNIAQNRSRELQALQFLSCKLFRRRKESRKTGFARISNAVWRLAARQLQYSSLQLPASVLWMPAAARDLTLK